MGSESASSIIAARDISLRYNDEIIFDSASFAVAEGERIGMVGRNGSGKSTFLKILVGEKEPDKGEVIRRRDLVIGYLPQDFQLDEKKTVFENIRGGADHVLGLIHEFEHLPADSAKHNELEERILSLEGWTLEQRIATAMDHLNVPAGERMIKGLSGGEKRRVAMCRAIISRPDLLILDEPTNHLDPESIEWLEEYLREFKASFVMVTHDRYFLDRVTSSIVEVAQGRFFSYTGNYSDYLAAKAEREATEQLVERKRQSFLRRELEWVRRGPKAQTSKSKARLDQYYEIAEKDAPVVESNVEMILPPAQPLGNRVVDLINVGMDVGGRPLFRGITLNFEAGMRVGVAGRNGVGKTTLLKIVLGQIEPVEGSVKTGTLTKFNYVDQSRLQLNEEKTVLEEIYDGTEFVIFGNGKLSLRAYLKRFLFTDDRLSTKVKYLSGGERSRLLLARILKNGGNFLILDEPTNDLDLNTLRVLEEALIEFAGVVLVVSHDRYFLNRVCNGMLVFEPQGRVSYSAGNYDYYIEKQQRQNAPIFPEMVSAVVTAKPAASKARKLSWKEQRELEGMEAEIGAAEAEIARLEQVFAEPDFHRRHGSQTVELNSQLEKARERAQQLYARWEELEAIAAQSR
ncbi:MAG: ABC-F family ATP-binding cassette domain-containing protein [Verrucomicrobiota bacterium]|nr:ABC-F family ATP-binding cassette domain-containing protein [Verrucomicrobiota bacterium]